MFVLKSLVVCIALTVAAESKEEEACYYNHYETVDTISQGRIIQVPDENWVANALKDVSYYLRNYKFNEWDRRFFERKPDNNHLLGYYQSFPDPPLRTIHWKVYDNCHRDFYKCIIYLHSVIKTAPFTRTDDIITLINDGKIDIDDNKTKILDADCKKGITNAEVTGLPFEGPLEKFQWRTSASYYMCWYTILGIPELSLLGEKCDNFANCLNNYSPTNQDPRADNRQSFACAMYSFCPDPCCPLKFVKHIVQCYEDNNNPCILENVKGNLMDKVCKFNRSENQNFEDLYRNKWNVSCHCTHKGYLWRSQFGMCIDLNECSTGNHTCDKETEHCLNLPGNYTCVCKYGYEFHIKPNKCIKLETSIHKISHHISEDHHYSFMANIVQILKYIGFQ